jgi:DNA-binding NarL/FixJ family response regulator
MHQSPLSQTIRVAVVEDDMDFQRALCEAICSAPDLRWAGAASTQAQAFELIARGGVDVMLVDLGLPDGSGIDVIRAAHARLPDCDIMVSTVFGDERHVMESLEAGAAGYLLKDSSADRIASEIRQLRAGGSPISPIIARKILMRVRPQAPAAAATPEPAAPRPALSAREQEVLELITKGFTAEEIAGLIDVSRHTVSTFVRRIYRKLEVRSKTEAIYEARHRGLVNP